MEPVVQSAYVKVVVRGPAGTPELSGAQLEGAIEEAVEDLLLEEGAPESASVNATAELTDR